MVLSTIYFIISLFSLGALIGMYLLSFVLRNKKTPKIVAYIHGAMVGTAFILLFCYATGTPGLTETVVIFAIAASGGVTFVIRDISKKSLPKWLALAHASIALTGYVFLLVYAFRKEPIVFLN